MTGMNAWVALYLVTRGFMPTLISLRNENAPSLAACACTLTGKFYRSVLPAVHKILGVKRFPHYWMTLCTLWNMMDAGTRHGMTRGWIVLRKRVYAHISVQSWKIIQQGIITMPYLLWEARFLQQKCLPFFNTPTLSPFLSADQHIGIWSCGISIWDLWSLIVLEQ